MRNAPYPWQKDEWAQVQALLNQKRLPHALLLSGSSGLGKKQFAINFSQSVLCEERVGNGHACGACRSCRLFEAGTHPDFLPVFPEAINKPIRVDAVRKLIDFLILSPSLKSRRIVMIHPADALNIFAANSLLKTLEEPSASALLLLVTDHPAVLPPTVRSRCQSLHFKPRVQSETRQWLYQYLGDKKKADLALAQSHYAPLSAVDYADEDYIKKRTELIALLLNLSQDKESPGTLADKCVQSLDISTLNIINAWIRDIIRVGSGVPVAENPDYDETIFAYGQNSNIQKLFDCLDLILWLQGQLGSGLNIALQLEAFFIRYRAALQ